MAIAPRTATPFLIPTSSSASFKWVDSRDYSRAAVAVIQRVVWHTKAYTSVLGILAIALASLVFLHLHWLCNQAWRVSERVAQASKDEATQLF